MESVVFEDTPLANYLEEESQNPYDHDRDHDDEEQNDLSGWGIEPPLGDNNRFAPSGQRVFRGISPLPLILNAESGKAQLRRQRFKELVARALQTKLNESENLQFLERFRYVLVSSDLLDGRVSSVSKPSNSSGGNTDVAGESQEDLIAAKDQQERREILFGNSGPWSILKMHDKYWVGGGGCIVVMATLVTWSIKSTSGSASKTNQKRSAAVLVVVICMSLYLFAHSRRRTIRMLRAKAIAYASHFVRNNQQLDQAVIRCTSLIAEVDLLSQGYRPDLAPPASSSSSGGGRFLGNSNMDSRMAAKHLRSGLSATLYLAMTSLMNAVSECLDYCSHLDLMRYLDIYDVRVEELGLTRNADTNLLEGPLIVLSREMYYGPEGANISLTKLKHEFNKLHLLRRTLMCCLLSIPSSGECDSQELIAWTGVTHHLKNIGELFSQLARAAVSQRHSLTQKEVLPKASAPDWRGHTRAINDISSTMQHVEARLQVLGDAIDSADYFQHYELVGEEIRHMLNTWERGYHDLGTPDSVVNVPTERAQEAPPPLIEQDGDGDSGMFSSNTTLADGEIEWRPFSPRMEMAQFQKSSHHRRSDTCSTSSSMTIIQGVAEDDLKSRQRTVLSRQDRIKMMQQNREVEKERKMETAHRQSFVNELDTVLKRRS